MWNLKTTYPQNRNRNRLTDIENRLMIAKGEGAGGETEEEIGVSKCKLLYIFNIWSLAGRVEKAMATHSSVLAWRIPGTGEPGGLPSMG